MKDLIKTKVFATITFLFSIVYFLAFFSVLLNIFIKWETLSQKKIEMNVISLMVFLILFFLKLGVSIDVFKGKFKIRRIICIAAWYEMFFIGVISFAFNNVIPFLIFGGYYFFGLFFLLPKKMVQESKEECSELTKD